MAQDDAEAEASSGSRPGQLSPEKPAAIRQRSYIVLSFWLIVLFLGLPIWWSTTAIYRAELPLEDMLQWSDGKSCRPQFPLRISIQTDSLHEAEAQHLLRLTQHALDDLNDFSGHHLRLQLAPRGSSLDSPLDSPLESPRPDDGVAALTIRLSPGESTSAQLHPQLPVLDVSYPSSLVPSPNSASSALATFIANELRATFAEEQAIISSLLSTSSMSSGPRSQQAITADAAETLSKRSARSLRYSPTYHLTFSLFTAGAHPSSWEVEAAIDAYIKPVLDVLRPIHNFTIDTQVQLYAVPGVQSQVLSKDHLASFINAAEWPLSPSIGKAPTINFVVYVGDQTISLDVNADADADAAAEGETWQSWMIPQWGTVYLLNLNLPRAGAGADGDSATSAAQHIPVPAAALKQPMLTFAGHLLSLLGAPQSGSLPLRLSTLARIRSTELLLQASSTLGSLARLTLALPSISIPRSVADGVSDAMYHLERACANLDGPAGLFHARIAEEEAERAFFEKSMVGQLYFPNEHKIAVYLPLLGPIGVPLVLGLLNEVKNWVKKRRQRAKEAEEKKSQ